MTDTVILARFGKKEDFQEFQLDKRIVKRIVAEIFGCSMNEPIWVFYEKKICAELILEESCFTPEKKGMYFVARAQDLKEDPYSVETYLGGLRRLQRGQEDNAIDSDFQRMSKQIRPNTAILAHYGYEHQRFFELPLNESVPKTSVAEICDGQRTLEGTEPFWIFYQQDLCTSLKNDSFTPTENNIYLVARAKDLRDYPRSVEAYKSGIRVPEPPLESLDKPSSWDGLALLNLVDSYFSHPAVVTNSKPVSKVVYFQVGVGPKETQDVFATTVPRFPKAEELLKDLNLSGTVITLLQKLSQINLRPLFQSAVPIAFNFTAPVGDRREALLYLEVKHGIKVTKENKSLTEMATSADVARERIVNGYFKNNKKKGTEFVEKSFTMFVTDEYIDGKMLDRARLMKFLVDKYEKYMDKSE